MQAEKRHEVRALMGEVHKAAGSPIVSALSGEVRRLMRGSTGVPAEKRAERVENALKIAEAINIQMVEAENPAAAHAAEKAIVLLQEAVEAGEPESKHYYGGFAPEPVPAKSPEMVEAEEKAAALVAEALASVE